jgi:hypothetical protein
MNTAVFRKIDVNSSGEVEPVFSAGWRSAGVTQKTDVGLLINQVKHGQSSADDCYMLMLVLSNELYDARSCANFILIQNCGANTSLLRDPSRNWLLSLEED